MLNLLYLLVKYGYYANLDDINELMPPLVSLLKFNDDKCSSIVCNMGVKALKVIDLFFEFRAYLRLQVTKNYVAIIYKLIISVLVLLALYL